MSAHRRQRRGLLLVLVLAVLVMVGGMLTLLATYSAQSYRARQADRVRLVARAITESVAGYARTHAKEWSVATPEKTIDMDVSAMVPTNMSGAAHIEFVMQGDRWICRVSGSAEYGPCRAASEMVIPLGT